MRRLRTEVVPSETLITDRHEWYTECVKRGTHGGSRRSPYLLVNAKKKIRLRVVC